jgi:hypothetical protein
MAGRATLRASDAEREQVAERLRHATTEGRLLPHELEQRLEAAFSARTYGQLDALLADLPDPRHGGRRAAGEVAWARPALSLAIATLLALAVIALVLLALTGVLVTWWLWLLVGWWFFGRHRRWSRGGRHPRSLHVCGRAPRGRSGTHASPGSWA